MNAVTSLIKHYPQIAILGAFLGGILVTGVTDGRSGLKTHS
jgi:hypothetical protein